MNIIKLSQIILGCILYATETSCLDYPDYPEGYFPFEQSPTKNPPKVRRPPYAQSNAICTGALETKEVAAQSLQNLCGNLNEGYLPVNPMGQKVQGQSYPFELLKNFTLDFFSKTLPILKEDETLPKVAKYLHPKNSFVYPSKHPSKWRKKFTHRTPNNFIRRIRKKRSIPEIDRNISGISGSNPGISGNIPGISGNIPGIPGNIPGISGNIPDNIPGISGDIPGISSKIPGISGIIPGISGNIPGISGNFPGISGNIPGILKTHGSFTTSGADPKHPDTPKSFRKSRDLLLHSRTMGVAPKRKIFENHLALEEAHEEGRSAKAFCDDNWGFLCLLYNKITGRTKKSSVSERKKDFFSTSPNSLSDGPLPLNSLSPGSLRPLTPCPSAAEYVTPVFARNYQGVWRYVVQIPYEGYFTQTVEITQCLSSSCHYLSGSCLSSPRWVSLLVSEIYYPNAMFPTRENLPMFRRSTVLSTAERVSLSEKEKREREKPKHCDGMDDIGCFQVRLYYDWFLVPGSCKCWKQDFYAKFALKNT